MIKVYDDYDFCMELIGVVDNMKDVRKLAKQRYLETDGECAIYYGKDKKSVNFYYFIL